MKIIKNLLNNKTLFIVILIYIFLLIVMPSKSVLSAKNSIYYIKEMLFIMPVILILTALIDAWVPKKVIINNLGENTGLKGIILSFILGSVSAGPIYAAFPVCKTLLKKGASICSIVIILSAWAVVKVPMLANEAKFLGLNFMFIRWILTSICIILMGLLISKIITKKDLKLPEDTEINFKLQLNDQYCIGCGKCVQIEPDVFALKNGKAYIKTYPSSLTLVEEASENCPVGAIILPTKQI